MKRLLFCVYFLGIGCHTAPPIKPKIAPTSNTARATYHMQSIGYACPISSMDDLHRGIYLKSK